MKTANRHSERVAAFFDLDGTLLAAPSLEWRFFADLRQRSAIPLTNYFLWVGQAARLLTQGLGALRHANKMYLRGVPAQAVGPNLTFRLNREAVEQVAWHAAQGHAIVLVSGTLAPLARCAAAILALKLALRGLSGSIEVCATELEEVEGRWTGRIVGQAMFGEAKARVLKRFAREHGIDLSGCFAYADSISDLPLLEAVGWPVAMNPSRSLMKIARHKRWPILDCGEMTDSPQHIQGALTREQRKIWENRDEWSTGTGIS